MGNISNLDSTEEAIIPSGECHPVLWSELDSAVLATSTRPGKSEFDFNLLDQLCFFPSPRDLVCAKEGWRQLPNQLGSQLILLESTGTTVARSRMNRVSMPISDPGMRVELPSYV
jgi:hypothetical protein